MKTYHLVLACAAALLPAAAQAVDVGECGIAAELIESLAKQGQRVLVDAAQPAGRGGARIRITGSDDGSVGYVLTGGAKACVQARVSAIRSASAPVADPLAVYEVRPQCDKPRADKAWCGSLDKAMRQIQALDVARVFTVGPSQALSPPNKRGSPAASAIEQWSSGEYGFCNAKAGQLVLCIATRTLASAQ